MEQNQEHYVPEQQTTDKNLIQRIIGVFFSPYQTFVSVRYKPGWPVPFIILMLITIGITIAIYPIASKEQETDPRVIERIEKARERMVESGKSDAEIEQSFTRQKELGKYFAPVGAAVITAIKIFFVAALFLLLGNVLMGGTASFWALVSMYSYANFITISGFLIKLPIIIQKESVRVFFSIPTILPISEDTFWFRFLNNFAVFEVWQLIVVIIGFAAIYRFKIDKAAIPIAILWLLYTVLLVATLQFSI